MLKRPAKALLTSFPKFHAERLMLLCLALGIRRLCLFDPPGPHESVGLLVDLYPNVNQTAFDLGHIQHEMDVFFGQDVVLVERKTLQPHWRPIILKGAVQFFPT